MSEAQRLLQANSMLIEMNQHSTTRLLDAHRDFAALLGDGPSTAFCEGMERRIGELEAELASVVANFTAGRERADCPSPSAQSPGKNGTVEEKYERLKAKYHRQLERHTQRERELAVAVHPVAVRSFVSAHFPRGDRLGRRGDTAHCSRHRRQCLRTTAALGAGGRRCRE